MRKAISLWLATVSFAGLIPATTQAQPPQPKGRVYEVPVENTFIGSRAQEIGSTAKSVGHLTMPFQLDTEGTLTLTVAREGEIRPRGGVFIRRYDLPKELRFLCGDASRVYIPVKPAYSATYRDYDSPGVFEIPYNRAHIPAARRLQLVDIENTPLPADRFHLQLSNSSIGIQEINLEIGNDGQVPLHTVNPLPTPRVHSPYPQYSTNNNFNLTDKLTNLLYNFNLHDEGQTSVTRIIFPMALNPDQVSSATKLAAGQVLTSTGEPVPHASISLSENKPYRVGVFIADPAEKKVTGLRTDANGYFSVAAKADPLDVSVYVPTSTNVYRDSTFTLNPNTTNSLRLPMRVNLPFECTDENGTPIRFQPESGRRISFNLYRVDTNDEPESYNVSIHLDTAESTGTVYTINDLPVPGRYMLKHNETYYGPVDVKDTTPTEPLRFPVKPNDGVVKARVLTESGAPISDALVLYHTYRFWADTAIKDVAETLSRIHPMTESDGLSYLNSQTSGVIAYVITKRNGEFSFPRSLKNKTAGSAPRISAVAANRFGATHYEVDYDRAPLYKDVQLGDIRLPGKASVTGLVNAPPMVPDNRHPGKLVEMWGNDTYRVNISGSRSWFGQRYPEGRWQWHTESRSFPFGKPFKIDIPAGTSVSLSARPSNGRLKLSMEVWKNGPLKSGQLWETTSTTLRALQPYTLQLKYANGSPARQLQINTLYSHLPKDRNRHSELSFTDENGEIMLYGDEGLAPALNISGRFGSRSSTESFKIQKLDMSTSVPTLTLTLDPAKWTDQGAAK